MTKLERWSVSGRDRAVFFRSVVTMFEAGIPIDQAFAYLGSQSEGRVLARCSRQIAERIRSGRYLSNAMASFPELFPRSQIKLVVLGEKTGTLGRIMARMAVMEEQQDEIRQKVGSALAMPLLVSALCLALVLIAPPFLFSGLLDVLREGGASMPWPTRLLIACSDAFRSPLAWSLGVGVCAAAISLLLRDPDRLVALHRRVRALPWLGPLLRRVALTRFVQALAVGVSVGLPLQQALQLSAETTRDDQLEADVRGVVELIQNGEQLSEAFRAYGFPGVIVQAAGAGEESGSLGDMLESIGRMLRTDLEHRLELATRALEPLLLCFMGGVVCFTLVAVLLPMLKVIQTL